ncbi:MAG TPA: hypothetical protein VJZ32_10535 [Candidatus Bathyarchaeia archaeon]|nr:hypothetical protein [Candidatus Bathyarchaeia archaeon]HKM77662.1 hypothetical protein [Candidatus Bathyarchaeia archaeon]
MYSNLQDHIQADAKKWGKEILGEEIESAFVYPFEEYVCVRLRAVKGAQALVTYDLKTGERLRPIVLPEKFVELTEAELHKLVHDRFGVNPVEKQ